MCEMAKREAEYWEKKADFYANLCREQGCEMAERIEFLMQHVTGDVEMEYMKKFYPERYKIYMKQ